MEQQPSSSSSAAPHHGSHGATRLARETCFSGNISEKPCGIFFQEKRLVSHPSIHFFACLPPLSPYAPLLVAPSSLCLVFVPCKRAVCGLMRLLLCFSRILALPFPCALSARVSLLSLCCTCVPFGCFRCVFFYFLSRFVSRSSSAFFSRMALSKHSVAHTLGPSYLCVASFSPSFAVSLLRVSFCF